MSTLRTGVRGDRNRLEQFRFMFSDGVVRTFWAMHYDVALENAKVWGLAHGRLDVTEGGAR